jgi:hypothetical protein
MAAKIGIWCEGTLSRDPRIRRFGDGKEVAYLLLAVELPDGRAEPVQVQARGQHLDWIKNRKPIKGDSLMIHGTIGRMKDNRPYVSPLCMALDLSRRYTGSSS